LSKEGFDNETRIMAYLNCKKYSELNNNMKAFIKDLAGERIGDKDTICCCKKGGAKKGDIGVLIKEKVYNVSIKSGSGNSVHQEPVEDFIKFLKSDYSITQSLANDIRLFIWGDGTTDGSGEKGSRVGRQKLKTNYAVQIKNLNKFFSENRKELIRRFVVSGKTRGSDIDYLYYGKIDSGFWASSSKVVEWLSNDQAARRNAVSVGRLTFQAWNRNVNGGDKSEHKRGQIQLKWGAVGKDLEKIMKE